MRKQNVGWIMSAGSSREFGMEEVVVWMLWV